MRAITSGERGLALHDWCRRGPLGTVWLSPAGPEYVLWSALVTAAGEDGEGVEVCAVRARSEDAHDIPVGSAMSIRIEEAEEYGGRLFL